MEYAVASERDDTVHDAVTIALRGETHRRSLLWRSHLHCARLGVTMWYRDIFRIFESESDAIDRERDVGDGRR